MESGPGRKPTVMLPYSTAERLDKLPLENIRRDQRRTVVVKAATDLYLMVRELKVRTGHLQCMTCKEALQILVGDEVRGIEIGHQVTCPRHFERTLVLDAHSGAA